MVDTEELGIGARLQVRGLRLEKGITIMIEDMVLVTETGHENLSPHAPPTPKPSSASWRLPAESARGETTAAAVCGGRPRVIV